MASAAPNINSKLPNIGTTIFAVMSKMANEHNAINLSQGFPDFPISPELIELVNKHMRAGHNQYAPMTGILPLREKIAEKTENIYGLSVDPDLEVNITSGATEAIYAAVTASIREGDEVIVLEPYYDCYIPAIQLNGGIPISVPLNSDDYSINWDAVKKRISGRTKMIMINTPHNPTGAVLTADDLKALEKIVRGTDILILSDEVYEHIIFDGLQHESILKYPELYQRSFVIFSFGKTYHNTGWKMGYCIAPQNLMKEFRKVHQFMVFSSSTPFQYAFAEYMDYKEAYTGLHLFYQEKRDIFIDLLKGSRFSIVPAKGTYFQLAGYKDISDEPDIKFAERLTKEYGVAGIPISVFYSKKTDDHVLRFCFAKERETMEKAAELLHKV